MSSKHKSKGSNSSNDPLPSLCLTISSVNSSTKSLSLKHSNQSEPILVTHRPSYIPMATDNTQKQPRRWDESQLALELAEDDLTKSKIPKDNHRRFKSKIFTSFRKLQRRLLS
ncbi:hypothetical protein CU097_012957 [Rhizopus azygosporus]|uniref:Uncharacterized protein n=1 Tax=Rhizopus azygosporus TaxID=86630 RepID=A0A367JV03_RHIAZ|nr:hypothetical protein CU097_012957 [Rhizopus azygosporus]CEI98318.1 hypothetical protein RMCBS344292_12429 [Rhizopus microsporus]